MEEVESRKKLKKLTRMDPGELKCRVAAPDLVELGDVNSPEPVLLIEMKACRNTVEVPRHWSLKRSYLQNKRGFLKPPFKLPEYIENTGIGELRSLDQERESFLNLRARSRQKARPKVGRNELEYTKLYNAFFTWAKKPRLTGHGDVYFENKERIPDYTRFRPGELSQELKIALGMLAQSIEPQGEHGNAAGGDSHQKLLPPPWLVNMQRNGPPPAYPGLKIPGLNAPIPPGCYFGLHQGGWGKPPVDHRGRPLYGDVFGLETSPPDTPGPEDLATWGAFVTSDEEEEDEDEDEEEEETKDEDKSVEKKTGATNETDAFEEAADLELAAHFNADVDIELRKRQLLEAEMEESEQRTLYTVLPEISVAQNKASQLLPSTHAYKLEPSQPDLAQQGSSMPKREQQAASASASGPQIARRAAEEDLDKKFEYKF